MWDVLVVNGLRHILIFFMKKRDYNRMMLSNFSGLTVPEDYKD